MGENYPKARTVKTADGTIIQLWGKQMHSWDGPAYTPQGDSKKAEYYVYGIKFTKDKWLEAKKEQVGLPFWKSTSNKFENKRH